MSEGPRYYVRVARLGPSTVPFGWESHRDGAFALIECAAKTFPTRVEALLASARVVASLALVLIIDTTKDYLN